MRRSLAAQTAIEYLLLTSFLLVATGLIFAYASTNYQDATNSSMAQQELSTIVNAAEQTYALGEGSVLFVDIETPSSVKAIRVDYGCKDNYRTLAGQECTVIDPDKTQDICCAVFDPTPGKRICTTPEPGVTPDGKPTCYDLYSMDDQALTARRAYLVFTQQQSGQDVDIIKQSRAIIGMDAATIATLVLPGPHTIRVEWSVGTGKVLISAVS